MTATTDLSAKLLIATPAMTDPRFARSVIYLCVHSAEGAMGLIVNRPSTEVSFTELLDHLEIPRGEICADLRVHYGGPVEQMRGFVLHSADFPSDEGAMRITDDVVMSATRGILESLASGGGPNRRMLALGYSGWGPGQLDDEIAENAWLIAEADAEHGTEILFDDDHETKWIRALATLGIDPVSLSAFQGRA